jgi:ABC-type lipoprotein release transport system permease subunit
LLKIPLRYNTGSLWARRTGSAMTVFGIGLTVSIFIIMTALVHGLEATFVDTGRDDQLIVIRQGSLNETNSYFNRDLLQVVRFLPGIARGPDQEPLAAGEIVVNVNHDRISGDSSNLILRGTSERALALHPEARIVAGRMFRSGLRELIASRAVSLRFKNLTPGSTVHFGRSDWSVVGLFDSGGTAYDSEIWGDYGAVADDWDRPIYSSILLRLADQSAAAQIEKRIADDPRINLQAVPQRKYFADQASTSLGVKLLANFIAVVMGIGACFAAMNMMYGSVMARAREVATLRAIGFRRRSILASFLLESALLALLGGILGCLLALPMHGISSATANFETFSEVVFAFRITPGILLRGMIFALIVGIAGGYLPARRAARLRLIELLKE